MSEILDSGREYYRTRARIPVNYGPDNPETRRVMAMDMEIWDAQSNLEEAARTALQDGGLPEDLSPLRPVLKWLDFKLDLVLHHLRNAEREAHFPQVAYTTDISGSGFGLEQNDDLEEGKSLLMTFTLPDSPSRPIFAAGLVVRVEPSPPEGAAALAVHFREIGESDREHIIRYTFQKQRQELARRSGEDLS